ncbi:hypothetical protein AV530_012571 [Patagioenas fasciata monilis]|uniref:Uncharacterized protein n=1 Tax=Patagioenas fasciata monilis TaxID=372326 RepID=A0A1V4JBS6_PATFA|nr:hypothetical protein AV530_012571 [Patagioenas fasciata monilis]
MLSDTSEYGFEGKLEPTLIQTCSSCAVRRKGLKMTLKYKLPKQLSKLEAKPHWIENTNNLPVTRGFKTNCRDFL